MLRQSYLASRYCWQGRSIQVATIVHDPVEAFMARQPNMRVFSGLRRVSRGDHRCGCAIDLVPLAYDDVASARKAYAAAVRLQAQGKVAYVEPFDATWLPGNHHVHVSFRRCPPTVIARAGATLRRILPGG